MSDLVQQAREDLKRLGLRSPTARGPLVPDFIERSWRRSISVGADEDKPCSRQQEFDRDSRLLRSAQPVLGRWQAHFADTDATLYLCDQAGAIVSRVTPCKSMTRKLEGVNAIEGFNFSEESVGTNGLGTALAERRAVYIAGSQHFNNTLARITCSGAPIIGISGKAVGSVAIAVSSRNANRLLVSMAKEIAEQIEGRLRVDERPEDLVLAMSFTRYRNSSRPTVVIDERSVLANTAGLAYISVASHIALWDTIKSHNWSASSRTRLDLPELGVSVWASRVLTEGREHFELHFIDDRTDDLSAPRSRPLSPADRDGSKEAPTAAAADSTIAGPRNDDGKVVLIEGPRGSGRATAALGVRADAGRSEVRLETFTVAPGVVPDWAEVASMLDGGTDVMVRRLEDLPVEAVDQFIELAGNHRTALAAGHRHAALVATLCSAQSAPAIWAFAESIGVSVTTEPLARAEHRVVSLVHETLRDACSGRDRTVSAAAMQALMRYEWPGNLNELISVITSVAAHAKSPVIELSDLPVHVREIRTRRRLSPLEEAERATIMRSLRSVGGNKSLAAGQLGIGRATLYRRIRQLDINLGASLSS